MLQAEDVSQLVQGDRLDVEGAGHRADAPRVLGVVEMDGLGQGVRDDPAAGREVGVGEDAADHRVIGIVGRAPVDGDVGRLRPPDFGEEERHRGGPGREAERTAPNSPPVSAVPSSNAKVSCGAATRTG